MNDGERDSAVAAREVMLVDLVGSSRLLGLRAMEGAF
jgi:hypothetical protein